MDVQGGNAFSLFQTAITLESRVSERTAELTRLTHRLMHEISERRAAEDALRAAKIEAEQAESEQDEVPGRSEPRPAPALECRAPVRECAF